MGHSHDNQNNDGSLKFGLILNSAFTIVEFIFGILTGSLALIADASHNLTDTFTLAVSYFANKVARKKATQEKTFGYGRATILAALLNCTVMLAVAIFIVVEAIQRLQNPVEVEGGVVAIIASIGIVVNGSIAYVLSKRKQDLNMRSAYIDMAFDAISSLAAVISGLVIVFTGLKYIDTVVGLLIAALLVYNTIKILREAIEILLEGTPRGISIVELEDTISAHRKVLQVDDMHVWAIRSGYNALSCHIAINEQDLVDSRKVVEDIKSQLKVEYGIQHATIEVELENCSTHKDHEEH